MKSIAVIYWSGTGNTQQMAIAIAEGAKTQETEVVMKEVGGTCVEDVLKADAIALGCPSMGSEVLGIPVEDVVGFIKHKGENSLLCNYWKVYHNPHSARILFECYDKAREDVRESIKNKFQHNLVASA